MRIKKNIENINYDETQFFFQNRAKKYNSSYPYSVTMYQDSHPELTEKRNIQEVKKLRDLLRLDSSSRILDLACGIGRWAEQIDSNIDYYYGVDFASNLIEIAKKRITSEKKHFLTGAITNIQKVIPNKTFNRVLIIGALVYLNDNDIIQMFTQIEHLCESKCIICIREPIALEERLTLKDFFSEELASNYNAIYRTRPELINLLTPSLLENGFSISLEGFLFENETQLNNRKETSQYFFILQR